MCGRYQRRADKQRIAEAFQLGNLDGLALEFAPDYNAAPQSMQPVIVWDKQFGTRSLHMMFWRFLPPYVTDPRKFKLDTINAKGETLFDSNTWRYAFRHHRCLVPVDSFIEWKRIDPKTKLPWMFAMKDDELFALAALYRRWRSPDRKSEWTPSRSSPRNRMNCWLRKRVTIACQSSSSAPTIRDGWSLEAKNSLPSI